MTLLLLLLLLLQTSQKNPVLISEAAIGFNYENGSAAESGIQLQAQENSRHEEETRAGTGKLEKMTPSNTGSENSFERRS
jgi:hypothetical protein